LAGACTEIDAQNGRRYHGYREGAYMLVSWFPSAGSGSVLNEVLQPNDEEEQNRMDLVHHVYRMLLGGKLFLAPIAENPQRVLDIGTGTGLWAIDFAE